MASPNLMDKSLLDVLRKGNCNEFNSLLNPETMPSSSSSSSSGMTIINMPSESESADDSSHHPQQVLHTEADPNSTTPQGLIPKRYMPILQQVTSAGDGVLHIAVRHGHLNLVCYILRIAGIEGNAEQTKAEKGAREGAREGRHWCSCKAIVKRLCEWAKSCFADKEEAPGQTAVAMVEMTVGAAVTEAQAAAATAAEGSTASSSSRGHKGNASQGRGEGEIAGTGDPQQHHEQHGADDDDNAVQGTIKLVELLRARNKRGDTCLHEAVRWGHTSIVRRLIAADAMLNDTSSSAALVQILDEDGVSPLYLATTLRRGDIVECLTDKAACRYEVSDGGPAGKTALHAAVLLSKDLCELLLDWKESLAKRKDESGRTPLHYLGTSDTAITKFILQRESSTGYCEDSQGRLPIHVAASRGRLDVIEILVEKCPDCESSCNEAGQTFLHVAVLKRQLKIVNYVCKNPRFAHLLNERDTNGDTALHLAVRNGHEYIFCSLFGNKEICLSFINKEGHTPLDLAFSSIESDHVFKQRKREWILNDLMVAGADFCTFRWDHFSSSDIKRPTDEKESENLSKSAGLIAAGAALILSMSFAAPFTIANKNLTMVVNSGGGGDDDSARERAQSFKNLVEFDAFSLTTSSLAIFFCMIAGFHTSRIWTRSVAVLLGGSFLYVAAEEILMVFAMGLSQVYPRKMAPRVVWSVIVALNVLCLVAAVSTLHLLRVVAHIRARRSRLGALAALRSLFRFPPGVAPVPQWHVALHIALVASWIINTRYLFTSKSMSMPLGGTVSF